MNEIPVMTPVKRPFYQLWIDAVTKPTVPSYEGIAAEPDASLGNAALWLFIAMLVGSVLSALIALPFGANIASQLAPLLDNVPAESRDALRTILGGTGGGGIFGLVCGAPIGAVFGFVFYFIGTAIQSWIARLFGGTGAFEKFFFVNAAFYAPIFLVTSFISNIPLINCLTIFVSLYALYLNFVSLQAVHKLTSGKAVMVILIPLLVACFLVACILFVGLAVLAPVINNVFQNLPK